jgi:hypothetical protein
MWLASADVTGERNEHRIGYGPDSVIKPRGEVVAWARSAGAAGVTVTAVM